MCRCVCSSEGGENKLFQWHVVNSKNACINITHIMTAHIHAIRNLCHRHNNIMMTIVNNMHNKIVLCNA